MLTNIFGFPIDIELTKFSDNPSRFTRKHDAREINSLNDDPLSTEVTTTVNEDILSSSPSHLSPLRITSSGSSNGSNAEHPSPQNLPPELNSSRSKVQVPEDSNFNNNEVPQISNSNVSTSKDMISTSSGIYSFCLEKWIEIH